MVVHRRKVLIVDNEPAELDTLLRTIEALQMECVAAGSGIEALQKFSEGGIGLVITDVCMPGMSGLELLSILKDKDPDLPVVLTSGYDLDVRELTEANAWADQFLPKPYRLSDVLQILQRFL